MLLAVAIAAFAGPPLDAPAYLDGDIVLHQSRSAQSAALRAATGSPYTHVGLVFRRSGRWEVLEAVQPVRWTPLEAWLARGAGEHIVVVRASEPLSVDEVRRIRGKAESYLGRSYDLLFQWSDDRIYCSELVYKAYAAADRAIGDLVPLRSFDLDAAPVRALIERRAAEGLNREERVVAPSSMLDHPGFGVVRSTDPRIPVTR